MITDCAMLQYKLYLAFVKGVFLFYLIVFTPFKIVLIRFQAGSNGLSLICVITSDNSIVLCSPSAPSHSLLDRRCVDKVSQVDEGIWIAFSGTAHCVSDNTSNNCLSMVLTTILV